MKIKVEDYEIEQEGTRFNLKWLKPSKARIFQEQDGRKTRIDTDEDKIIEVILGYGMTLERCLSVIVGNELTVQERTVNLQEWVEEYRKITDKFILIFKNLEHGNI